MDLFNIVFDIYFELSDFKVVCKYCNCYIENIFFFIYLKYVYCNVLLVNYENSEDYFE